jgi:hypothetical protein
MMRLFISSFGKEQCDWVKNYEGPKSITSMDLCFELFLKRWGPPCQDYKSALNNYLENKEDEVPETMEIEETLPLHVDEDLEYQRNIDEVSAHDNFEENLSTQGERIGCLDELRELFHEGKKVIDILFHNFQRNPSYELGAEINLKIEENNALLELIKK